MNAPEITIGDRKVGPAHVPLVVAEIGINHNGSLQTAFEMVDAAQRAGVEVVKHQTHVVDDEMSAAAKKVVPGNASISIYEIMAACALSEADDARCYCQESLRLFGRTHATLLLLAYSHSLMGSYAEGLRVVEEALALEPDSEAALDLRARLQRAPAHG